MSMCKLYDVFELGIRSDADHESLIVGAGPAGYVDSHSLVLER